MKSACEELGKRVDDVGALAVFFPSRRLITRALESSLFMPPLDRLGVLHWNKRWKRINCTTPLSQVAYKRIAFAALLVQTASPESRDRQGASFYN